MTMSLTMFGCLLMLAGLAFAIFTVSVEDFNDMDDEKMDRAYHMLLGSFAVSMFGLALVIFASLYQMIVWMVAT